MHLRLAESQQNRKYHLLKVRDNKLYLLTKKSTIMTRERNYSYKDVDMLMACKVVAENFKANIAELAAVRSDWTEAYAWDLSGRVTQTIETHLGIDAKKELRNATSDLSGIQLAARRDLSFFKTQIDEDFKAQPLRCDEILNTLGFSKFLKDVQKGNQEALVQQLYAFKKNMSDSLRNQIVEKGTSAALIDRIVGYALTFNEANTSQEGLKQTTKTISQEVIDSFNTIFAEIIGICKKASVYYQYDVVKKEQFTFSKVVANLGSARKAPTESTPNAGPKS